jgi:hypothetical protein
MTRCSLVIAATLLLLTGCDDDPAPIYTKPFAQWRETGVAALPLPTERTTP